MIETQAKVIVFDISGVLLDWKGNSNLQKPYADVRKQVEAFLSKPK
jgi:virulence-associated protein VapD